MNKFSIDPFPPGVPHKKNNFWIYGRAEREAFRLQKLIKAKNEAALKVGYPGMLNAGATTFFEAYGEGKTGKGLYDFYDRPFALSLCHAWSSAPAFLLPMIFKK